VRWRSVLFVQSLGSAKPSTAEEESPIRETSQGIPPPPESVIANDLDWDCAIRLLR